MDLRSFWSWFDVNRSTFDEDMSRKQKTSFTFSFPVTLTFDLNSDLKFAPLVTVVQRYVSTKLEICTNVWSSLPFSVVTAPSINSFKNRLDEH